MHEAAAMPLLPSLPPRVIAAIGTPVSEAQSLAGGVISSVHRLRLRGGASVICKQHRAAPPLLYRTEAEGLRALAGIPGIRVPAVLALGPAWILLEDLGPQPSTEELLRAGDGFWERFGRGLAHLHGRIGSRFGWDGDTCWGLTALDQRWRGDGHAFYAEQRFRWYARRPNVRARLSAAQLDQLERIADRLPSIIPAQPPCLLHGDLWFGNRLRADDGSPAVVDPCIHYGWAEADLANALMFGGFPERFYDAYLESHPLEPGWRSRNRVLWILHLLSAVEHEQMWGMAWLSELLARFGA